MTAEQEQDGRVAAEIESLRREMKIAWDSHRREHAAHDQAHDREHVLGAEALRVASKLAEENKAAANEWRAAMNDRETRFATREALKALADVDAAGATEKLGRIEKLERADLVRQEREAARQVRDSEERQEMERRQSRRQWEAGIVISIVVVVVNLLIRQLLG